MHKNFLEKLMAIKSIFGDTWSSVRTAQLALLSVVIADVATLIFDIFGGGDDGFGAFILLIILTFDLAVYYSYRFNRWRWLLVFMIILLSLRFVAFFEIAFVIWGIPLALLVLSIVKVWRERKLVRFKTSQIEKKMIEIDARNNVNIDEKQVNQKVHMYHFIRIILNTVFILGCVGTIYLYINSGSSKTLSVIIGIDIICSFLLLPIAKSNGTAKYIQSGKSGGWAPESLLLYEEALKELGEKQN